MNRRSIDRFRVLLCFAGFVCAALPANADATRAGIEAANAQFMAAVAKGDAAGLAALYASDGHVMPPGGEAVVGREAIQKYWQGALSSGVAAIALRTVEILGQGSTVSEVGTYELRDKAGKSLDRGKYIVVWRQEGGHWRLLRDMFSTNLAPAKT